LTALKTWEYYEIGSLRGYLLRVRLGFFVFRQHGNLKGGAIWELAKGGLML
jgi:hypothetical protein